MLRKYCSLLQASCLLFFQVAGFCILPDSAWSQVQPSVGNANCAVGVSPGFLHGIEIVPGAGKTIRFLFQESGGHLSESDYMRYVRYFLAALAIPEDELWVNLSPIEKNRIIPRQLGRTGMGKDLLEQDLLLKRFSSSLLHPDTKSGQEFLALASRNGLFFRAGGQELLDVMNKVWIVPDEAVVHEHAGRAVIIRSHLRVLMASDREAVRALSGRDASGLSAEPAVGYEPVLEAARMSILPYIEREVNEGGQFAVLRQIYSAMILAEWYKRRYARTFLWSRDFIGCGRIDGFANEDGLAKEKIYREYLRSFREGVFNVIREDVDPFTGEMIPRKYFSGGFSAASPESRLSSVVHVFQDAGEADGAVSVQDTVVEVAIRPAASTPSQLEAPVLRTRQEVLDFLEHKRNISKVYVQIGFGPDVQYLPLQWPGALARDESIREITFILDVDRTLTSSEFDKIDPLCLDKIVGILKACQNSGVEPRFIFITGSPFHLFRESIYAPPVSEWDWEQLWKDAPSQEAFDEFETSVKEAVRQSGKTSQEFRAFPFLREKIKRRIVRPIIERLREDGLLSAFAARLEFVTIGGWHVQYDVENEETAEWKEAGSTMPADVALAVAKQLFWSFLNEIGSKEDIDFDPYFQRLLSAGAVLGEGGVESVIAGWQKEHSGRLGYSLRLLMGEQGVLLDVHNREINGAAIAKDAFAVLQEQGVALGDARHRGGSHYLGISQADKARMLEKMDLGKHAVIVGIGDSGIDTHLTMDHTRMFRFFVGPEASILGHGEVVLVRDANGGDRTFEAGTARILGGFADMLSWGGGLEYASVIAGRYSLQYVLSQLPEEIPPGTDVDKILTALVAGGKVMRIIGEGGSFVFQSESAPGGNEAAAGRGRWVPVRNGKLSGYLVAARAEHRLMDVLRHHEEYFGEFSYRQGLELIRIAAAVDLYTVRGSRFLFPDGPLTYIREGNYRENGGLQYSSIWFGESVMRILDEDEFALFLLLEARKILTDSKTDSRSPVLTRRIKEGAERPEVESDAELAQQASVRGGVDFNSIYWRDRFKVWEDASGLSGDARLSDLSDGDYRAGINPVILEVTRPSVSVR